MTTQNEDSNIQQFSPGPSMEHLIFDRREPSAGDALPVRSAAEAAISDASEQGVIDEPPRELVKAEKSARTRARPVRGEPQTKAPDSTALAPVPARVKRVTKKNTGHVKDKADSATKPKRASSRKTVKGTDGPVLTTPVGREVPPLTREAIEFLGKRDAMAADVLKLGADSLAFVQYHFKHMRQLEVDSQLTDAYLVANARPAGPVFQQFADALMKHSNRERGQAVPQAEGKVPVPEKRQLANVAIPSYGQKSASGSVYAPVVVQLGKLELASDRGAVQAHSGESTLDDNKRAHRVLGTARILMSAPINDFAPKEAADLVANDVKEVRAIKDIEARRLALNAMVESSLAQPRYQAEFAKQAPDLVEPANQAYKTTKTDWDLAYEVSSTLSFVAEAVKPLTKDETVALAKRTIETIRAIKGHQYRQEALAFSYQISHWQPPYKEEFARQAPDLVVAAEAAYRAEEARTKLGQRWLQALENSIERSPVQLVTAAQQGSAPPQATAAQQAPTVEQPPEQTTGSAAMGETVAPNVAPTLSLSQRFGLAISGAANWARSRLSWQGRQGAGIEADLHTSLDKSAAGPAQADDRSIAVPESIARRFIKVECEYYFHDRSPAFSDQGNKLATRGTNPEVIRSLVEIAKTRGWDTITVKGTEDFRRKTWMEAAQSGLTVVGYKPGALDLADLANRPANNTVEKGAAQVNRKESTRSTAQQSRAQINPAQPAAAVQAASKEPSPDAPQTEPQLAEKAKAFQENKPAFVVKKYPDLAAAYGIIAAAKAFATDKLPEAARGEFVDMARRHMVEKIMAGEQIQGPKIYLAPAKAVEVGDQIKMSAAAVDQGRTARAKAVERER